MSLEHKSVGEAQMKALRTALIEGENSGAPTAIDFDQILKRLAAIAAKTHTSTRKKPSNNKERTS